MRRLLCIFLLMLLPLHSFAVQGGWLSHAEAVDMAHELEHAAGKSHHHEDDGAVHYDESVESAQHFIEHSAAQQTATLPTFAIPPIPAMLPLSVVISGPEPYIPDRVPERPQRPPTLPG